MPGDSKSEARRGSAAAPTNVRTAKTLVYTAAALMLLGGILAISGRIAQRTAAHHTWKEYKMLNTTVLQDVWLARRKYISLSVFGAIFESMAYVFSIPAFWIIHAYIQKQVTGSAAYLIMPCFALALTFTVLDFLYGVGELHTAEWVATWEPFKPSVANKHLHDGGWGPLQSLEVSYMVSRGKLVWVSVFDYLLLSVTLFLSGWYTHRTASLSNFHKAHKIISFIGSGCAHLAFWFGILRFAAWGPFMIAELIMGLLTFIMLPLWFVSLGKHLNIAVGAGYAKMGGESASAGEIALSQQPSSADYQRDLV